MIKIIIKKPNFINIYTFLFYNFTITKIITLKLLFKKF